ncbi:MAG TPA: hypothetical protein VGF48_04325 [Thermoanaerobaculia bacterium]|jgi:hypothetical protein
MRLTIVLDREFGDRLEKLAFQRPVWIVESSANRTAAEAAWLRSSEWPQISVTVFRPLPDAPSKGDWEAFLAQLALHDPVTSMDFVGAPLTLPLRAALTEAGFGEIVEGGDGFRARRS